MSFVSDILEPSTSYEQVSLATYPRSGNHWMRYLIEKVTGIATSSVYIDQNPPHLPILFPWGGYSPKGGYEGNCRFPKKGDIVLIKTHYPTFVHANEQLEGPKERVVNIVRHPIDCIYSYYVWRCRFEKKEDLSLIPQDFLETAIKTWRIFHEYYANRNNTLMIRFEDLLNDPFKYLKETVNFIGYKATDEAIQSAVDQYPPKNTMLCHAKHYTEEQLALIKAELAPLLKKFGYE